MPRESFLANNFSRGVKWENISEQLASQAVWDVAKESHFIYALPRTLRCELHECGEGHWAVRGQQPGLRVKGIKQTRILPATSQTPPGGSLQTAGDAWPTNPPTGPWAPPVLCEPHTYTLSLYGWLPVHCPDGDESEPLQKASGFLRNEWTYQGSLIKDLIESYFKPVLLKCWHK